MSAAIPPATLRDSAHVPAGPVSAPATTGISRITASQPQPVPEPVPVTRTALTVAPEPAAVINSPIAGIAPVTVAATVPVASAPAPASAAADSDPPAPEPVSSPDEVRTDSAIAGGDVPTPFISLPEPPADPTAPAQLPNASEPVIALAARLGVDLAAVTGTGKGGRILRKDVEAAISAPKASAPAQAPAPAAAPEPPQRAAQAADLPVVDTAAAPEARKSATVRLPFNMRNGRTLTVDPEQDLVSMAANALPGLLITSAVLEVTAEGPALAVSFADVAAVTL